jgi:transcriptional regulator
MHVMARPGTLGVVCGHLAKANRQWRNPQPGVPFLAAFVGPEGYISPSLYPSKREHGRVVPTWNYIAVHAHGTPEFFDDPRRLHALVSLLTVEHERDRAEPWHVSDAPDAYIADQLKGVVGFEMPIDDVRGKWKLAQNRTIEDRRGVATGLERDCGPGDPLAQAVLHTFEERP